MSSGWIRGWALATIGAVLSCALIALTNSGSILADVPWPTPPPGPQPPGVRVIDTDIKPAAVPAIPGAISWLVLPQAMSVPRFPPVPRSAFDAPAGVHIVSDAGSITSTVQLVYAPISIEGLPSPGPGADLRKVFDLRAFDHQANRITLKLRRPWVLEVPIDGLTRSFEEPSRLLLARYDEREGWVPLVTIYHRHTGMLETRLLDVGRFAVIMESLVISGGIPSRGFLPGDSLDI